MGSGPKLRPIADERDTRTSQGVEFRQVSTARAVAAEAARVLRKMSPFNVRRGVQQDQADVSPEVLRCLKDQVVLVTGAGGSIGSELARQISAAAVRKLVVLDQDENSIFELMSEMGSHRSIVPHIADIRDREAIRNIFSQHAPDLVFHAAAYKHVPLMEQDPCEAVITNVAGTREITRAAMEAGAKRFVFISTDKAVKPSSIMGASKRAAEMLVQQCAYEVAAHPERNQTQFASVRFGNVLGTRGSVLPIFLEQIAAGGPITLTNAEMTRFFMTVSEAVRLVLQAATLASHGDIYMLDMGDPVRIMDLARDLVQASGLVVDRDIEIQLVGTRPGEKLHEQLWDEKDIVTATPFQKVFRLHATPLPSGFLNEIEKLIECARERRSDDVRTTLRAMPLDYDPERAHKEDSAQPFVSA